MGKQQQTTPQRPSSRDESPSVVRETSASLMKQDTPPRKSSTSANVWATGSNQNAGNFLSDRPTTRVHAPPGGHSSIRFG